jgi:organic hydroperoxide reductase OsmC/OhrA
MTSRTHTYAATLRWDGNTGQGTASYADYARDYSILVPRKPELAGSADPAFRGDPAKHNPEELFLAAIAACHMLFYLALCARQGVRVLAYEDEPEGRMVIGADGGGRFEEVVLRPAVTIGPSQDADLALRLHDVAHERCFIANSCKVPIRRVPTISHAPGEPE